MEESNNYLRELLEQRGWYKRWYTQVMADILLPQVTKMAQPEKNAVLSRFKEEDNNMLALYLVKEFLRTVCLPSTGKIFEAEAGITGVDQDFQAMIQEHFSLLKPSTAQEINPPLLAQALHIWKVEAGERQEEQQDSQDDVTKEAKAKVAINRILRRESSESTASGNYEGHGNSSNNNNQDHGNASGGNMGGGGGAVYRHYTAGQGNGEPQAQHGCRRNRSRNCKRCN